MNFDAVTIMALLGELGATLSGGRVQDTLEVDEESIGLEIYANHQRHYLLLSAHQQFARVHLSSEKLRRGVEAPSPLGLLLRRYVEGFRFVLADSMERLAGLLQEMRPLAVIMGSNWAARWQEAAAKVEWAEPLPILTCPLPSLRQLGLCPPMK